MTCTALSTELSQLREQRSGQVQLIAGLPNNAGKQVAEEQLARIDADIASTQAELADCLAKEAQAQHPVPQNIRGAVKKVVCHEASSEVSHDEPYLLIASFDMLNIVNLGVVGVTLPAINVVKVGPWLGVGPGDTAYPSALSSANRPAFWDLDAVPKPIAHPQDVIFLVACMENDGSSPDAIRGGVRTNLLASRATNTNRQYNAYVTTMISNMTAAIEVLRVEGLGPTALNRDDLIGGVQHLALTTSDLAQLNGLDPVDKSLRFTQRKANGNAVNDYTVTFSFTI